MKYLKLFTLALISVFAFNSAQAQLNVRIGGHPHHRYVRHHHYRRHVVIVHHR